ncbi:hypothetical protein ACC741_37185, partial [Rhizobium johnstonii]
PTPPFASRWLIPRLPDLTWRHPDLDLHILATDRISSFPTDGVDLAVRYGSPPFVPGLDVYLMNFSRSVRLVTPIMQAQKSGASVKIATAWVSEPSAMFPTAAVCR